MKPKWTLYEAHTTHYSLNVTRLEQKPTNLAELLKRQQQQQQTNKQTNKLHSANYGESVWFAVIWVKHWTATVSFQTLLWDTAYVHVCFKKSGIWQLVLDGVVDMDVGYEANDPAFKHPSSVYLSYFI